MILIADVEFPDPDDTGQYCEIIEDGSAGPTVEGHNWHRSNHERQLLIIPKVAWYLVERGLVFARGVALHTVDAQRILTWLETGDRTSLGEGS